MVAKLCKDKDKDKDKDKVHKLTSSDIRESRLPIPIFFAAA